MNKYNGYSEEIRINIRICGILPIIVGGEADNYAKNHLQSGEQGSILLQVTQKCDQ